MVRRISTLSLAGLVLALSPLLMTLACGAQPRTPRDVLEDDVMEFHRNLRWARYDEASVYVSPQMREAFLQRYRDLGDDFQVTEFEIQSIELADGRERAVVLVWYQAVLMPNPTVQETVYRETWDYDDEARAWQLVERVTEE